MGKPMGKVENPWEFPWKNWKTIGNFHGKTGKPWEFPWENWKTMGKPMGNDEMDGEIDGKYHVNGSFGEEIYGTMKSYGDMMGYERNGHENVIRLEFNGGSWDIKQTIRGSIIGYRPHPILRFAALAPVG